MEREIAEIESTLNLKKWAEKLDFW
jgi:hypothetical protein